ncbi:hypothetical protein HanPI659440_Chr10g0391111 [Helianthus annuus]|nr:hypothetical protein HanPI659440_Chr10g0391111 [Helianthus annuus]
MLPSSFLANKTGVPHGEILGHIKPLPRRSCSWGINSFISVGAKCYDVLAMD